MYLYWSFAVICCRIKTNDNELKPLPACTICPMSGFKQRGFFYKKEDAYINTLNLDEIISAADINDTKSLMYQQPIAQQIGRCFSLYNKTGLRLYTGFEMFFKTSNDLKVFIHHKGDELWLAGLQEFPFEVATLHLQITKWQNFSFADIGLKEVRSIFQTKPERPCVDYSIGSEDEHELFANCSRASLWKHLPPNITCTIADMHQFIPRNSTMKECKNTKEAENVYWKLVSYLETFISDSNKYGCPVPCRQTSYKVKMEYFHKNNALLSPEYGNLPEGHFTIHSSFLTFSVEEKIESLEYDLPNLLVSAGGNLGLFLGFSCLSVMFAIIEWLKTKCSKYF